MTLPSHAELDAARHVGDPEADRVVTALGRDVWAVQAVLRQVHRNADPLPSAVPEVVRRLFDGPASIPTGFDEARAHRAQRWASDHLFHVTVSLFCASLPTAYGAALGSRVLSSTGRMRGAALDRRVNETARFVLDVLAPGGFGPDGAAVRAIQKVRLVHAAVRAHLFEQEVIVDEVPINQEDMLGTLFTFSVTVLRSVERLGVWIDEADAEDFWLLWRDVGAMLGIREHLLPADLADARDAAQRVADRQLRSSPHGRELMAELLAGMETHVRMPALRLAPRHLVRHLVGDRLAEQLGVPQEDEVRTMFRLLPRSAVRHLASLAIRLSPIVGQHLLQAVIAAKLDAAPHAAAVR